MSTSYEYDTAVPALYIRLSGASPATQVELSDGVIVDLDARGRPVGIDVMNPAAGWDVDAVLTSWTFEPREADFVRAVAVSVLRDGQVTHGGAVLASVA